MATPCVVHGAVIGTDIDLPCRGTAATVNERWLLVNGATVLDGGASLASWQLMSAGHGGRLGLPRFVGQQVYYSLQAREPSTSSSRSPSTRAWGAGLEPAGRRLLSGKSAGHGPRLDRGGCHGAAPGMAVPDGMIAVGVRRARVAGQVTRTGPRSAVDTNPATYQQLADNLAAASLVLGDDERPGTPGRRPPFSLRVGPSPPATACRPPT